MAFSIDGRGSSSSAWATTFVVANQPRQVATARHLQFVRPAFVANRIKIDVRGGGGCGSRREIYYIRFPPPSANVALPLQPNVRLRDLVAALRVK
jgi:hypothetical protein